MCDALPGKAQALDHAISICGYGTDNGVDYWILGNSWGQGWGEKGFARIEMTAGGTGACGIQKLFVAPTNPRSVV